MYNMYDFNYLYSMHEINWQYVWNKIIMPTFDAIYDAMNSITIIAFHSGVTVSLWDFCLGIIVMGAIINLFINFTTPTLPDRTSVSSVTTSTTGNKTKTTKSKTTTTRFN